VHAAPGRPPRPRPLDDGARLPPGAATADFRTELGGMEAAAPLSSEESAQCRYYVRKKSRSRMPPPANITGRGGKRWASWLFRKTADLGTSLGHGRACILKLSLFAHREALSPAATL
jgi:hypothetical protein